MQSPTHISNAVKLPPIQGLHLPPLPTRSHAMWALIRKSKKWIIAHADTSNTKTSSSTRGKSRAGADFGRALGEAGRAALACQKKLVVYVPKSDVMHGFDHWVDAIAFIEDEKPVGWWLDSLEPPSFEVCKYGVSVKTSQGKARQTISLTDLAGVAASASKFLCPWSIVYSWEGGKQEAKDNTKPVLAEKTPRDQFQISESFGNDVMLASLNMPFVEMPTLFNDRVKHLMMQEQKIQEKFSQGASAVAADRSSDMPYIILRGKNFLVTYGWAPNALSPKLRDEFLNLRVESQALGESLADVALDELFARAFEISVSQLEAVVDSSTAESDACDADRSPPHHLVFYYTKAVLM
jgi:hypothetical protein